MAQQVLVLVRCSKSYPQLSIIRSCNKLGYGHNGIMPSNNNDIINRPFADLQERMAEVDRLKRSDDITNRREVDYRAIWEASASQASPPVTYHHKTLPLHIGSLLRLDLRHLAFLRWGWGVFCPLVTHTSRLRLSFTQIVSMI